jgi:glycosyltransferase involved in cell wall biosynthesis
VIHFVSGEYPPDVGGVGDYTVRLRAALAERGTLSTVITRRQVGRWDARALAWIIGHLPSSGVVHVQYQAGAFDLLGDICLLPLLLRRLRPRTRTVTTFHDVRLPYLFPRAGGLRARALQLLALTSHAVIGSDRRDLQSLGVRGLRIPIGSNVSCAPPDGYDRNQFRAGLGLETEDLAVVYFGLLNASKGLDLLLATMEQLIARKPRTHLLLLGGETGASDPTDRVTARAVASKIGELSQNVTRTGWLPPRQLSAYLLAGNVALLPYVDGASARRGSLLACAAHGLPIVSTLPAGAEVASFVRAVVADAAPLADAVLEVSADVAPWQAASRVLSSDTSWPRIAAAHTDLYDQLSKGLSG